MTLKQRFRAFVRIIQKGLAAFLLFFAYIFGFGVTALFMRLFNRKMLGGTDGSRDSFWVEAKGYGHDDHDITRQS